MDRRALLAGSAAGLWAASARAQQACFDRMDCFDTQLPGPSLDLQFTSGALDPRITFTRASVASYFDVAGVLQTAGTNVARFDYDPVTHAAKGLLIEEARTNSIRNSTMVGASPGTPGTLPTNWTSGQNTTLNPNVIGTGTENGIPYIDLQITGTAGAGVNDIKFDTPTGIAGLTGQTWTFSSYLRLISGTLANVSAIRHVIYENTSGGVFVTQGVGVLSTPTGGALNTQRKVTSYTTAGGGTVAALQPMLELALTAGAVNFTLRVGTPQLELGAFSTSAILTLGAAAVTRAADVASMPFVAPMSVGTLAAEGMFLATAGTTNQFLAQVDDGSSNNRWYIFNASGGLVMTSAISVGGVNSSVNNSGTMAPLAVTKQAASYTSALIQTSLNGSVAVSVASTVTAVVSTTMRFGSNQLAAAGMNGWLRRVRYWPRGLSAGELQAMTQ